MKKTAVSVGPFSDEKKTFRALVAASLWRRWVFFWAKHSGISALGRLASRLAYRGYPPHKAGVGLAELPRCGYFIAPGAIIYHQDLLFGKNVFIADRVILYQSRYQGRKGGEIVFGDGVRVLRDSVLETGLSASILIGEGTWIHPRCQLNAYQSSIIIGKNVDIAPGCAFYSYDHGTKSGQLIRDQALTSKGPIVIEDEVWFGFGAIVLSGVRIGKGSVIGAGSVVTKDVPENSIACGSPAKKLRNRS